MPLDRLLLDGDWRAELPRPRLAVRKGDLHTVPVGFDANGNPKVVMDILMFDRMSADESLALTNKTAACGTTHERGAAQFEQLYALFIEHRVPTIRACLGKT